MCATSTLPDTSAASNDVDGTPPAPFAGVFITITRQEHIELKLAATKWQGLHRKAVARLDQQEVRHVRLVRELKAQALKSNVALQATLGSALAHVRDLQNRLFSTKSEQCRPNESRSKTAACRKRGQQRGTTGHGRTIETHLSERHEDIVLNDAHCPECGQAFKEFAGTEDAQVLEIEVKACRRVIHRHRYSPTCQCGCVSEIIAAPSPARLIERGKFGISVWASVLLDKFAYGRPTQRLLQDLADHGLNMSPGTLAGGLQAIAPLFKPLDDALLTKLRSEPYWHADETGWAVFVDVLGKVGHRWYMWVFQSHSVVNYVVDKSRAADVIITELAGVETGIISCDRYSGYKRLARLNPSVTLAFCWAHQRRDFLDLANSYPQSAQWALQWVDRIGNLYHLNAVRLNASPDTVERISAQQMLEQAVQQMAADCSLGVANHELFPPAAKVLQSMTAHWAGLIVFVACPWVDIDNNQAERSMRSPVVGRKNFNGSGSEGSAELAATMYSLFASMKLSGLNLRTWLTAYLQACADNGNVWLPVWKCIVSSMDDGCQTFGANASVPPSGNTRHFMTIYCARDFSPDDLQTIRDVMAQDPKLQRSALSRKLCQLWGWTKPNGELKDMTCRVALLRMQADGLIELPPSQIKVVRRRAHFAPTAASDAQAPITQPVHELGQITLQVVSGKTTSLLWNEYMARYHYLGYAAMSGSQIRYNVSAGEQLVACISFCACAWKLKDREIFIGWNEEQRQRNLQLVINNARFLVLPWIQCKGLASKILSLAARQLPRDWKHRYGFEPVLLQTFVEYERHRGTCYKAANWVNVGRTTGRVKKSISHERLIPAKDIWLYPLRKNFATLLCKWQDGFTEYLRSG